MKWSDQNQILIGGILLVIVSGSFGYWLGGLNSQGVKTLDQQDSTTNLLPKGIQASNLGGNHIRMSDQDSGMQVFIGSFALARDGWVVIHEDSLGSPGNILGARRFAVGAYENGLVELLRATEPGRTYYAMLHGDDGDRKFDHSEDLPVPALDGTPVMARFGTTR